MYTIAWFVPRNSIHGSVSYDARSDTADTLENAEKMAASLSTRTAVVVFGPGLTRAITYVNGKRWSREVMS